MTPTEILEKMQGAHIAVVGDAMIDQYIFGRVERICPEAPVPIFVPEKIEERPGGAANVVRQLNALGCMVYPSFGPEPCIKTRYMAGQQLVLRVDRDVISNPREVDIKHTVAMLTYEGRLDAVVLSDYDKGWLSYGMCRSVIGAAAGVPVIVDPKGADWEKFFGCTLICPSTSDGLFQEGSVLGFDILLKRGADGMTLYQRLSDYGRVPAVAADIPTTARHVADVTGAGDCIVAVVAAALAVGASKQEAATLAALAAGWCVGEVGTVSCSREKLKELIDECN